MRAATCTLCLLLVGCVQTSGVIPTGKQTYYVHVVGNIGFDPSPRALAKANEYCAAHGWVATVTSLDHTEWPRITSTVQFKCSDAAHQSPASIK